MPDDRVLFLLENRREAEFASEVFEEASIPLTIVPDVATLCEEMENGCGAAVVTEEAFRADGYDCIRETLRRQPAWSQIPLVVLVAKAARTAGASTFSHLPTEITLLEAPVRMQSLVSVLSLAVNGRRRQYLVRDAMQELAVARQQAEAATRAKADFLADMSHDLRTPLAGIMGMIDLAIETQTEEKSRSYLQMARRSADSLLRLINDILDFSRLEAGKMTFERKLFFLRVLLEDSLSLLSSQAASKGLDLILDVDASVPSVILGDEGRLRQVLVNLLGNAVKFTHHGHVRLDVRAEGSLPDDGCGRLVFAVEDTGIGIAQEKLQEMFGRFTQAESSAGKYGGAGLGLAVSKEIIERMGGRIWATSEAGKGSTFFFTVDAGCAGEADLPQE
jgi:signal transduction histidine kinase